MHELDTVMRQVVPGFSRSAEWEAVMDYLEEIETRYAVAIEVENAQREN